MGYRMIKLVKLSGLFALLVSPMTLAADKVHAASGYAASNPLSRFLPASDFSLGYLKNLFGSMGSGANAMIHSNVSGSFGGFVMGDLFRVFNYAMLVFGVIMLMYMVFTATLKTAHEGDIMGRDWSSPWIMLRSAVAMVLLMPQASGYCLAQKVVMFIVLMGVAGANAMWSVAVDKMISEDTIEAEWNQQNTMDQSQYLTPVTAIYEQVACRRALRKKHGNGEILVSGPYFYSNHILPGAPNDTGGFSVASQKLISANKLNLFALSPIRYTSHESALEQPICGGVSWLMPYLAVKSDPHQGVNINLDKKDNGQRKSNIQYILNAGAETRIEQGVWQMYSELDHAGYYFADRLTSDGNEYICTPDMLDKTDGAIASQYGCFVDSMRVYYDMASDVQRMMRQMRQQYAGYGISVISGKTIKNTDTVTVNITNAQGDQKTFHTSIQTDLERVREQIKRQGWANIGSYFYDIAELSSIGAKDLSSTDLTIIPANYITDKKDTKIMQSIQDGVNSYMQESYQNLNRFYANPNSSFAEKNVSKSDQNEVKRRAIRGDVVNALGGVGYDFGDENLTGGSKILFDILTLGVAAMARSWDQHLVSAVSQQARRSASMSGIVNPIISLQHLGKVELEQVHTIWIKGLATIEGLNLGLAGPSAIPFIGGAFQTMAEGINSMVSWLTSIMTPISIMLFSSGFLLSVWLPFMPYVLSLFCVFGWLIAVVEMMVAGPIVALGLLSPEGQGVLGKAVPAVLLSMAIFLRPILMVLGFMTAIVAIFVASDIVNAGFLHMVRSVFHGHLGLFSTVGLVMLYTLVMTSLCNKSFGMMTQISDRVLRWIGGHNANFDQGEMQMLDSVKSGVGDVGSKAGEGSSKLASGTSGGKSTIAPGAASSIRGRAEDKAKKRRTSNIETK